MATTKYAIFSSLSSLNGLKFGTHILQQFVSRHTKFEFHWPKK